MAAHGCHAECFHDEEYDVTDRRSRPMNGEIEAVRLTRKYAERIDGVDLSEHQVGDRLPLAAREARLLIAEGWAEAVPSNQRRRRESHDICDIPEGWQANDECRPLPDTIAVGRDRSAVQFHEMSDDR